MAPHRFTRSKLDQLQDPKGVMEQWAQSFLSQQKADKARVTAELDAALASMSVNSGHPIGHIS